MANVKAGKAGIAVVVGVGPGLGQALGRRFAREGLSVGLISRRLENLTPVVDQITAAGGVALGVQADATDEAGLRGAFEKISKELGPPTVLLYNAGGFVPGGILDISPSVLRQQLDIGVIGPLIASQCVLPHALKAGSGTLLFTGATAALRGSKNFAGLAVPKFGLRALTQSLAREFHPQGVHVAHVIIDGQIAIPGRTNLDGARDPASFLDPDELAGVYWDLHKQPRSVWSQEVDVRPHLEKW